MLDARVRAVLAALEAEDAADATAGTDRTERSLQIAPSSGALLYALCIGRPGCAVLEIGGSRGYSTVWLGAAARAAGGRVVSLEADPRKLTRSERTIAEAGLGQVVEIVPGDAFDTLPALDGHFDVCFLDAWKEDYEALFSLVRPRIGAGGVVVADNVCSHADVLGAYSAARRSEAGLLSVTVPLDNGLEVTSVLTDWLHSG